MTTVSNAAGHAALAICESMLLALSDRKVIDEAEVLGILSDAATAHRNAIPLARGDGAHHEAAASLIEAIVAGGNSVRHP
jgi:hypothetical protein